MDYESWLAAMPVEGVRHRIATLEQEAAGIAREIELLRVLEREHAARGRLTDRSPSPVVARAAERPVHANGRSRRLSPERIEIIELIRQRPEGMSPIEIARALGKDPNPVQTTMSRMSRAGQLLRIGTGQYRLPTHVPADDLLSGALAESEVDSP